MKFNYVGVTRDKSRVSGVIEASDKTEAGMRLRAQQIRPEKIQAADVKLPLSGFLSAFSNPVSLKGLVIFSRQFSSLIDSGIGVVQCLGILQDQESRPAFKKILIQIKEDIEGGSGLAEALSKHPNVFSQFYVRVVEAGELSGTLDLSLRRVSQQLEKLGRLRAKVIGAVTYPALTVLVAIGAVAILLTKVFPELIKLYGNKPLPDLTRQVLAVSNWVRNYGVHLFVGSLIAGVIGVFLFHYKPFRKVFDPIWIKLPLFGTLTLRSCVARFARTLSTLVASGVPLLTAFEICEKVITNYAVADSIRKAAAAVTEGRGIATGLSESKVFPPMVIHMVNTGEITGRLDDLLGKVADIYDDEVEDAVARMTDVLQPMLIIFLGVIIMILMVAMYLPIINLSEVVSGI